MSSMFKSPKSYVRDAKKYLRMAVAEIGSPERAEAQARLDAAGRSVVETEWLSVREQTGLWDETIALQTRRANALSSAYLGLLLGVVAIGLWWYYG